MAVAADHGHVRGGRGAGAVVAVERLDGDGQDVARRAVAVWARLRLRPVAAGICSPLRNHWYS